MRLPENWRTFWDELLKRICERHWICPNCLSNNVFIVWKTTYGKNKEGIVKTLYSDDPRVDLYECQDCFNNWHENDSPLEYISWKEAKHKGYIKDVNK